MSDGIELTAGLVPAFVVLVLGMAGLLVAGTQRAARAGGASAAEARGLALRWAIGLSLWLAATIALAARGVLRFDTMPPTMVILLVVTLTATVVLARSGAGARLALGLPLGVLVLSQAFRLPLELIMHRLYEDGLMPVQMSYSGRNFDIVTGALAIPVGLLALTGRAPRWLVAGWNVLGLALLVNVLVIAILSAPTPLRVFMNEPVNVWVTAAPWVWLPTLLVPLALAGHLLVFRRLSRERASLRSRTEPALRGSRRASSGSAVSPTSG